MRTVARPQNTRTRHSGMTLVRAVPIARQEDMTCFFIGMEFLVEHPKFAHGMRLAFPYARLLEMDEDAFRAALNAPPEHLLSPSETIPVPVEPSSKQSPRLRKGRTDA